MSFARIANAHGTDLEATASLIFVAAVELVCGSSADGNGVVYFTRPAAGFFLIVAVLLVCSIVRFERRR